MLCAARRRLLSVAALFMRAVADVSPALLYEFFARVYRLPRLTLRRSRATTDAVRGHQKGRPMRYQHDARRKEDTVDTRTPS